MDELSKAFDQLAVHSNNSNSIRASLIINNNSKYISVSFQHTCYQSSIPDTIDFTVYDDYMNPIRSPETLDTVITGIYLNSVNNLIEHTITTNEGNFNAAFVYSDVPYYFSLLIDLQKNFMT